MKLKVLFGLGKSEEVDINAVMRSLYEMSSSLGEMHIVIRYEGKAAFPWRATLTGYGKKRHTCSGENLDDTIIMMLKYISIKYGVKIKGLDI